MTTQIINASLEISLRGFFRKKPRESVFYNLNVEVKNAMLHSLLLNEPHQSICESMPFLELLERGISKDVGLW